MVESIELPRKVGLGKDGDDGVIGNGVFELGFLTWFDLEEMERNLRMVRLIGFFWSVAFRVREERVPHNPFWAVYTSMGQVFGSLCDHYVMAHLIGRTRSASVLKQPVKGHLRVLHIQNPRIIFFFFGFGMKINK